MSVRNVEFVLVPEGWFFKTGGVRKGANDADGDAKVWLDDYYIAKYEARARDLEPFLNARTGDVTDGLYGGDATSCSLRKADNGKYALVRPDDDLPATHLSWLLAAEWARWMGFRLPSEAEWEKAARGEDRRRYPWGNDVPDETFANFLTTSTCLVWPVDRAAKGQSPYGLFNLSGNVREFVADSLDRAADASLSDGMRLPPTQTPPPGSDAERSGSRILKGGRWASVPRELRIAARVIYSPNDPFQCNGTRFAIDAAAVREHLARGTAVVLKH